jgi:hypothetical protein
VPRKHAGRASKSQHAAPAFSKDVAGQAEIECACAPLAKSPDEAVSPSRAPRGSTFLGSQAKYNGSAMKNRRQLQYKALMKREKSRERKNNEEQWKKQCAEQWKQ